MRSRVAAPRRVVVRRALPPRLRRLRRGDAGRSVASGLSAPKGHGRRAPRAVPHSHGRPAVQARHRDGVRARLRGDDGGLRAGGRGGGALFIHALGAVLESRHVCDRARRPPRSPSHARLRFARRFGLCFRAHGRRRRCGRRRDDRRPTSAGRRRLRLRRSRGRRSRRPEAARAADGWRRAFAPPRRLDDARGAAAPAVLSDYRGYEVRSQH
mmetsp:Transcript_10368/g.36540  ORF Transcript_10368/g.36540 Transcript_10368/m.36540 type:complete len:212 (-) Transcript_10368:424-1059(-)